MRTLTWDQGPEMARHQRLTPGTGVEVFFAHPHRSIQPTHCYHPLTSPFDMYDLAPFVSEAFEHIIPFFGKNLY